MKKDNPNEEYEHSVLSFWLIVFGIFLCLLLGVMNKCYGQTNEEVLQEILKQDIQHPEIVMAQCRLETGNCSSGLCKANHNLFGMKLPKQRETTALGERYNHAYYKSWRDSVKDYKLWQDRFYNGEDDYYQFLKNQGYATSKTYIQKLKQFKIKI